MTRETWRTTYERCAGDEVAGFREWQVEEERAKTKGKEEEGGEEEEASDEEQKKDRKKKEKKKKGKKKKKRKKKKKKPGQGVGHLRGVIKQRVEQLHVQLRCEQLEQLERLE
jgi:hypothetical protein